MKRGTSHPIIKYAEMNSQPREIVRSRKLKYAGIVIAITGIFILAGLGTVLPIFGVIAYVFIEE